jgi:hypothetical protein
LTQRWFLRRLLALPYVAMLAAATVEPRGDARDHIGDVTEIGEQRANEADRRQLHAEATPVVIAVREEFDRHASSTYRPASSIASRAGSRAAVEPFLQNAQPVRYRFS